MFECFLTKLVALNLLGRMLCSGGLMRLFRGSRVFAFYDCSGGHPVGQVLVILSSVDTVFQG